MASPAKRLRKIKLKHIKHRPDNDPRRRLTLIFNAAMEDPNVRVCLACKRGVYVGYGRMDGVDLKRYRKFQGEHGWRNPKCRLEWAILR